MCRVDLLLSILACLIASLRNLLPLFLDFEVRCTYSDMKPLLHNLVRKARPVNLWGVPNGLIFEMIKMIQLDFC